MCLFKKEEKRNDFHSIASYICNARNLDLSSSNTKSETAFAKKRFPINVLYLHQSEFTRIRLDL
jgi:hypothetical protein